MSDSPKKDVDEEPIPKLPRAKLFGRPSGPAMIRLGMFATMLYALIMMREPCANGAARFVGQFSEDEAAADAGTQPGTSTHYPGFQIVTAEEALEMLRQAQDGRDGGNKDGGNKDGGNKDGGNKDGGNKDGGNKDGGNKDGGNKEAWDGGVPGGI